VPHLTDAIQPQSTRVTPDQRQRLEARIDFALYLLTRTDATPDYDLMSSRQRGLIRGARQIALASIDPAKLTEGAF